MAALVVGRRRWAAPVLALVVALSGCGGKGGNGPEPEPPVPLAVDLVGCAIHQGIYAVDAAAAQALTPAPFAVEGYPAQDAPPARVPDHAEMDVAFLACSNATGDDGTVYGPVTYFALGFLVEAPQEWQGADANLHYYMRGASAFPLPFAQVLRAWGQSPVAGGKVNHSLGEDYDAARVARASISMADGRVVQQTTLPNAEPLDRPAERFRFFSGTEAIAALDVEVGPHKASLGHSELVVTGDIPWLAGTPEPQLLPASAYAGPPSTDWDIRLSRADLPPT